MRSTFFVEGTNNYIVYAYDIEERGKGCYGYWGWDGGWGLASKLVGLTTVNSNKRKAEYTGKNASGNMCGEGNSWKFSVSIFSTK